MRQRYSAARPAQRAADRADRGAATATAAAAMCCSMIVYIYLYIYIYINLLLYQFVKLSMYWIITLLIY